MESNAARRRGGEPATAETDLGELTAQAVTLTLVIGYLEEPDGTRPHLVSAAALLAPHGGPTDADRARTAAREVLRPMARRTLAEVLRRSAVPADGVPSGGVPSGGVPGRDHPDPLDPGAAPSPAEAGSATLSAAGTVRDPAGGPVGRAVVVLLDGDGAVLSSTSTDGVGHYRVVPPTPAVWERARTLTIYAAGFEPLAVTAPPPGTDTRVLTLRGRARVAGTVHLTGGGTPAPTRIVALDTAGTVVARVATGQDGRFVIDGLVPGVYTVAAAGDPPTATTVRIEPDADPAADVAADLLLPSPTGRT